MQVKNLEHYLPTDIYNQLLEVLVQFPSIDGPKRLSHLIGQCQHECGKWKVFTENLNYSEQGLLKTFPKYFTPAQAKEYAKKPEKIANRVYASRMGNDNEASGEPWLYIGRGSLQTTGKSNYKSLGDFLGVDLVTHPELVATKYQLSSAAFFFEKNKLWTIADKGVDVNTITEVRKRVNGSTLGLDEVITYVQEIYGLLKGSF